MQEPEREIKRSKRNILIGLEATIAIAIVYGLVLIMVWKQLN